jgi:hypothetical protein
MIDLAEQMACDWQIGCVNLLAPLSSVLGITAPFSRGLDQIRNRSKKKPRELLSQLSFPRRFAVVLNAASTTPRSGGEAIIGMGLAS